MQDSLSGASSLNGVSSPETAREKTILVRHSFGSIFLGEQENRTGVWGSPRKSVYESVCIDSKISTDIT